MIYHRSFISELVCAKSALVNRHDDFIGKSTDFYHYGQAHTNNHVFEKHFNQRYQQEPQLMHCVSINTTAKPTFTQTIFQDKIAQEDHNCDTVIVESDEEIFTYTYHDTLKPSDSREAVAYLSAKLQQDFNQMNIKDQDRDFKILGAHLVEDNDVEVKIKMKKCVIHVLGIFRQGMVRRILSTYRLKEEVSKWILSPPSL